MTHFSVRAAAEYKAERRDEFLAPESSVRKWVVYQDYPKFCLVYDGEDYFIPTARAG